MKHIPFYALRKKPLKKQSDSEVSIAKREIQRLLREIVIKRDGGCFIRGVRHCGGHKDSGAVLQADHLISRANSATYADHRLVVCVCRPCHGWKRWNKEEYDRIVRSLLPKDRLDLWMRAEAVRYRPAPKGKHDWKLAITALEQELAAVDNSP